MTQTQERKHITVQGVTVKSKAEAEDGYRIELDIPTFKSRFPIGVTRVSKELAVRLAVGQVYNLVLEQQRLKQGKNGQYPTDYYYGLVNLADTKPTDTGRGPSGQESPWEDLPTTRDGKPAPPGPDRQDLIMLQHATGVVAQAYGDWIALQSPEQVPAKFADYLKAVAMGATWLKRNHYDKGGYALQGPVLPRSATEGAAPDAEDGDTPF